MDKMLNNKIYSFLHNIDFENYMGNQNYYCVVKTEHGKYIFDKLKFNLDCYGCEVNGLVSELYIDDSFTLKQKKLVSKKYNCEVQFRKRKNTSPGAEVGVS